MARASGTLLALVVDDGAATAVLAERALAMVSG